MNQAAGQQIIISGVGGQGVLFITRLLAEAAIVKGLPVLTSETHGMAQRGGSVVSHFKIGGYASPLIRPGHADGLLALKAENIGQYDAYLKSGSWVVVNDADAANSAKTSNVFCVNADRLAQVIDSPKSVNLIVLGYAIARIGADDAKVNRLFCTLEDVERRLKDKLSNQPALVDMSLKALRTGFHSKP